MYCTGNATGVLFGYSFKDIVAFARDALPNATKMAYLYNPHSPVSRPPAEIEAEAQKTGFTIVSEPFTNKDEALSAMKKAVETSEVAFIPMIWGPWALKNQCWSSQMPTNYPLIVGIMRLVGENGVVAGIQYNWNALAGYAAGKLIRF